jgi:hypothetical protein
MTSRIRKAVVGEVEEELVKAPITPGTAGGSSAASIGASRCTELPGGAGVDDDSGEVDSLHGPFSILSNMGEASFIWKDETRMRTSTVSSCDSICKFTNLFSGEELLTRAVKRWE